MNTSFTPTQRRRRLAGLTRLTLLAFAVKGLVSTALILFALWSAGQP